MSAPKLEVSFPPQGDIPALAQIELESKTSCVAAAQTAGGASHPSTYIGSQTGSFSARPAPPAARAAAVTLHTSSIGARAGVCVDVPTV